MKYTIIQDTDPLNPRDDDGNVTTILTGNRRYGGGDEYAFTSDQWEDLVTKHSHAIKWAKQHNLYHRVMAYIHGGIAVRLDDYGNWPDQRWDCMPFGAIFVDPAKARHAHGWKNLTKARLQLLEQDLQEEFKSWKSWLEGDTYFVNDPEDDTQYWGNYNDCTRWVTEQGGTYD